LSTRVHELAKELGVKSQELLDRIQTWGFEVKSSIFAGLDSPTVEQIRAKFHDESAGKPAESPVAKPSSRPDRPAPSETPAIRSTAPAAPKSEQTTVPAPPPQVAAPEPTPAPATPAPARPAPEVKVATPAAPPQVPSPPRAPTPERAPVAPTPRSGLAASPAPAPLAARPPAPPAGGPVQQQPRPSGLTSAPRLGSGSGPLSRHTPHRSGPGGPPPAPTQNAGGPSTAPPPPARPEPRPNPSSPPPLRPSDYISPGGVRTGGIRNLNATPPPQRRPDGDSGQGGDGPRRDQRDQRSRPLPQVAASSAPLSQPRRPESRPAAGPEVKTQRPEMKFTREQLLEMRQSGNLGVAPPPVPGRGPQQPLPRPGAPRPGGGFGAPPTPLQGRGPLGPRPALGPAMAPPPPPVVDEEEERKKGKVGGATDRQGRRAKRDQRATARVNSPVPVSAITAEEEDARGRGNRRGLHAAGRRGPVAPTKKTHAEIEPPITVRTLSEATGIKANDLIRKMMNSMGQMVHINANLDEEAAVMLAMEFGVELEVVYERTAEDDLLDVISGEGSEESEVVSRPPIVTILGHVDHGKTSLLDRIRRTNVVDSESGGITQHIGAYTVVHNGQSISFVDTPGHEAFTAMRARGANVTDIVILVVAADDGVMPQTQEAIAHAKAAGVPIIIALNKIDLPNINRNKIFTELAMQELAPEGFGGTTPVVETSAVTGKGIDELLEMIGLVAETDCVLTSHPSRPASGTCLEALISEGRGAVARVLVQDGTLRVGDVMVCGDGYGRVRALYDDKGRAVEEAGPSTPVEVSGLDSVPTAGEKFAVIDDITRAREVAETRRERSRGVALGDRQSITLENLYSKMAEQKVKALNLILKTDVQGSLEALVKELEKLQNPEVPIRVLLKGVGGISESDILLAEASQAIVIGFRVAPEDRAVQQAEEKKIDIRRYDIIYQVTDEIKKAVEGMLVPEIKEVHLGRAQVRQLFRISKVGLVAGCVVTQGTIERSSKVRVIREGREIYKSGIEALKRFKDDVKEVREGYECGIKITNFDDLKADDTIEAFRIDVIRRTLAST
jgi:translation initiation factor IF-2